MRAFRFITFIALAMLPLRAEAAHVSVRGNEILVDGRPFIPNGAAGETRLAELKALGANVVRTYGQEPGEILDAAQRAGLKVIVGFWMGQPRLGFDYRNRQAVDAQLENLRHMVERYRNHPALLMWGIGNEVEVELPPAEVQATVWPAIEEAARMVKTLDPSHPTLAVLAEVGTDKARQLKELAPSIDVLGINGYGDGLLTAETRARAQGWAGPVVLTEMGPLGHWEAPKTPWGARIEPTSSTKADLMRRYLSMASHSGVGTIVFLWGQKQEVTPTWYSLLLPNGDWSETVEVMADQWDGTPPGGDNHAPRILSLQLDGPVLLKRNGMTQLRVNATDPDGDPLKVEWQVMAESTAPSLGGDPEPVPPSFPEAVHEAGPNMVRIGPLQPGAYRVFVTVRDGRGAAATGNVPILVR
ncbi:MULTISPECIES: glycoside hydrolase family 2 TIM barrel-domain containing protein [unclassified Xanthobacter]|uniref:glycoside hydrolase family 2 TIM barrel-domain containing protein n=1 Tax=unclassified Xanthobacter TaxID=2623496 RepID=UPI001F1E6E82